MNKQIKFFNLMIAFQQFAGQPLNVVDHADGLTEQELESIQRTLAYMGTQMVNHEETKAAGEKILDWARRAA